jgi:uncharacterized iron-regulated membrane protein
LQYCGDPFRNAAMPIANSAPQPTPPVRHKKRAGLARLWLLLHGWFALPLWAFLLLVCVTGTIATISQELLWLGFADVRAHRPDGTATPLGADALLARVVAQMPGSRPVWIEWPTEAHFAPKVTVSRPDGQKMALYVNAYDGHVQGTAGSIDLRYFIRALHGWLFLPWTSGRSWGWYAVTVLGLPMIGSLVTGILVYKKFWRAYLHPRLRIGKGARVFWGDFHRLAGIWSIPFVAIIGITGCWFFLEAGLNDLGLPVPRTALPAQITAQDVPDLARRSALAAPGLDAMLANTEAALPGLRVTDITLPETAFSPVRVYGRAGFPLFFESAAINPYDGRIIALHGVRQQGVAELTLTAMYPLHFGDFLGLWLKPVYFLFGLLLSGMVLSGMLVWTRRTVRDSRALAVTRRHPAPASPARP